MEETKMPQGVTSEGPASDSALTRSARRRGPKTEQGKVRVRLNAVRHGLCASSPVITDLESIQEWEMHLAAFIEDVAPVGYLEQLLADRCASLLWRLRRVGPYEANEIRDASSQYLILGGDEKNHVDLPREVDKIVRHEAHLSRQFFQALHELEALQARRRGQATPLARVDVNGVVEAR